MVVVGMMKHVSRKTLFVSYRRNEAEDFTLRLRDYLVTQLDGDVFVDTQNVRGGRTGWPEQLKAALAICSGIVVVIGPSWASDPRLARPDDWVRMELEQALAASVPVYVVRI